MIFSFLIFTIYIISKAISGISLIRYSDTLPNNKLIRYIYFWDMLYAIIMFTILTLNSRSIINLPSVLILIIGLVPLVLFFTLEFKIDKKYLNG